MTILFLSALSQMIYKVESEKISGRGGRGGGGKWKGVWKENRESEASDLVR